MKITALYLVTKPTKESELIDIVSLVDMKIGIKNLFLGGLQSDEIIGFYKSQKEAEQIGKDAIANLRTQPEQVNLIDELENYLQFAQPYNEQLIKKVRQAKGK